MARRRVRKRRAALALFPAAAALALAAGAGTAGAAVSDAGPTISIGPGAKCFLYIRGEFPVPGQPANTGLATSQVIGAEGTNGDNCFAVTTWTRAIYKDIFGTPITTGWTSSSESLHEQLVAGVGRDFRTQHYFSWSTCSTACSTGILDLTVPNPK